MLDVIVQLDALPRYFFICEITVVFTQVKKLLVGHRDWDTLKYHARC